MHIIYTLTQRPVSVVIKALKLEGLGKYRQGYTECVWTMGCTVVFIWPQSTVWQMVSTRLYNTYSLSLTNLNSPYKHNANDWYLWKVCSNCFQHNAFYVHLPVWSTTAWLLKIQFVALIIVEIQMKDRGLCFINSALNHVQCISIVPSQSWLLQPCEQCNNKHSLQSSETNISSFVSCHCIFSISCIYTEITYWIWNLMSFVSFPFF